MFCNKAFCPILLNVSHVICKVVQIVVQITLECQVSGLI